MRKQWSSWREIDREDSFVDDIRKKGQCITGFRQRRGLAKRNKGTGDGWCEGWILDQWEYSTDTIERHYVEKRDGGDERCKDFTIRSVSWDWASHQARSRWGSREDVIDPHAHPQALDSPSSVATSPCRWLPGGLSRTRVWLPKAISNADVQLSAPNYFSGLSSS